MERILHRIIRLTLLWVALLVPSSGCVGMASFLLYAWKGNTVPAKFEGLVEKKVAVVCVSDTNMYTSELAMGVSVILQQKVLDIEVIPQSKIHEWQDSNEWEELEYQTLGEGVGADVILAIELDSFRLYEGQTMYKGRAHVSLTVHDMAQDEKVVFSSLPTEHIFPVNAAYATTDMSEDRFRKQFIRSLAQEISRNFYAFDVQEQLAADRTLVAP